MVLTFGQGEEGVQLGARVPQLVDAAGLAQRGDQRHVRVVVRRVRLQLLAQALNVA